MLFLLILPEYHYKSNPHGIRKMLFCLQPSKTQPFSIQIISYRFHLCIYKTGLPPILSDSPISRILHRNALLIYFLFNCSSTTVPFHTSPSINILHRCFYRVQDYVFFKDIIYNKSCFIIQY